MSRAIIPGNKEEEKMLPFRNPGVGSGGTVPGPDEGPGLPGPLPAAPNRV